MLDDEDEIWDNIDIAFDAMSETELFKTWRSLTDTLGGNFPVIYNKTEFDGLIERMSNEELTELVEKSADFNENDLYFSIYDGQLYSKTYLSTYFTPIRQTRDKAYDMLVEKKLTLGSKRLEAAFTEDFDEDMMPLDSELECFFEDLDDGSQEWGKYVEGCQKIGFESENGPFPMEEADYQFDEYDWEYSNDISSSFNYQDEWFYYDKYRKQYFSFTDWDESIVDDLGYFEYNQDLLDYIIQTDDDLGIADVREILDKNKKYGYVSQKGGN